jgi:hypothetical protein
LKVSIEKEPNPKHHKTQKHPSLPNKTSDEKNVSSGIKEDDVENRVKKLSSPHPEGKSNVKNTKSKFAETGSGGATKKQKTIGGCID